MFDHLIVFGPAGAGVTPLGRAIASEAALSSLATFKRIPRNRRRDAIDVEEKAKIRTARFIDASSLLAFMRDIKVKRDITAYPTVDLLIEHGTDRVTRSTGQHDPNTHDKRKGANLVVIEDLTTEALKGGFRQEMLAFWTGKGEYFYVYLLLHARDGSREVLSLQYDVNFDNIFSLF